MARGRFVGDAGGRLRQDGRLRRRRRRRRGKKRRRCAKGFDDIARLEPADKGKALRRTIDQSGKPLLARLERLTPAPAQADCAADALGGARRSVGAMEDMVKLYDAGKLDELFGARIVASARNADQGLWTVEDQLRACGAR